MDVCESIVVSLYVEDGQIQIEIGRDLILIKCFLGFNTYGLFVKYGKLFYKF